jgi:hypothetical protein
MLGSHFQTCGEVGRWDRGLNPKACESSNATHGSFSFPACREHGVSEMVGQILVKSVYCLKAGDWEGASETVEAVEIPGATFESSPSDRSTAHPHDHHDHRDHHQPTSQRPRP